jgi:hypothetical protein
MKRFNIKVLGTFLLTVSLVSCSDILKETPRSIYTPQYFKTPQGVTGGITSLYASLRNIYGNAFYFNGMQSGTDESTWGAVNGTTDAKWADNSGAGFITPLQNPYGAIWGLFPNVNTASGIIENGQAAGVSAALIAEARFHRAFNYFLLVQTFGGVPLDLGAGELKFNTAPTRFSVRNTVPEVYTKGIFPDLIQAVTDLAAKSRLTGTVNTTVAQLFLAKAYLTYAWWLENPNGIPTYPDAPRTDPNGQNAAYYYQQAYNIATTAINTHDASIGLLANFYDVNWGANDRNMENLLYADHTQGSDLYNGSGVNEFGPASSPGSFSVWYATSNYTQIVSHTNSSGTGNVSSVQREALQGEGRPFTGLAPIHEAILNTFADKTNDSRYDGTFATVYRGNWQRGNLPTTTTLYNANNLPVVMNDPILTYLFSDPGTVTYPSGAGPSGVGAGTIPGRADWVVTPKGISRLYYPGLWKLGTYRTDNAGTLGQPNARLTRPFPIAKFSELYLIAAEAAVKGATTLGGQSARELVNVLRARAGRWRFDNANNVAKAVDNSAAMIAATPAVIDINYILDERSREFYGEGIRWYDLVRTQTWATRAATYTICGTANGDHTPVTTTRSFKPTDYLRPIPQSQLDGMEMTAEQKAAFQNPGY